MLRNKTFLKIFSLFAAVLLWIYVMGEVDPETREVIREVPVTFVNTEVLAEEGLAVVQETPAVINVTVEGKRSDVNDVKKNGLTAQVDVSQCTKGTNTGKITVNTPDGISIDSLSSSSLRFKVETLMERQKSVEIEFTDIVSGTDKVAWALKIEPEHITVRGAKSSIEKIDVFKGIVSANKLSESESHRVTVDVIPVTKDGEQVFGVQAEFSQVKADVQFLSIKSVDLVVTAKNAEDGYEPGEMEAPARIQIVGPVNEIEQLEAIEGTADLKGITGTATLEVVLELPENIFLLDESVTPTVKVVMKASE